MVLRDCNSNILNDSERFSNLKPGTVFCMVSFVEKKCVLTRREIRESDHCFSDYPYSVFKF